MSRRGDHVGVDNGVVETGSSLPFVEVLEAARAVEATEVVLPDVLGNGIVSYEATERAYDYLLQYPDVANEFAWMAVPHGRTAKEWLQNYLKLCELPLVTCIGISMFDHELWRGGRAELLDCLEDMDLVSSSMEYHILGCYSDVREVYALATKMTGHAYSCGLYPELRPWIRSMDTGLPVRLGLRGYKCPWFDDEIPAPLAEHQVFGFLADYEPNEAVQANIDLYKAACEGVALTAQAQYQGEPL